MSRAWILTIALLTVACDNTQSVNTPEADYFLFSGQSFGLRLGESAAIDGGTLIVGFINVLADTRCPQGSECAEPGAAGVVLVVQSLTALDQIQIDVPPSGDVDVVFDGFTIYVIDVRPEAQESVVIDAIDYIIGLRITNPDVARTASVTRAPRCHA